MADRDAIDAQIEFNAYLIRASEDWGRAYQQDDETHGRLIRREARLETIIRRHFRDMADQAPRFINWYLYDSTIRAYDVDVMVYDDQINQYDGVFLTVTFDEVAAMTAIGAQAGEHIYKFPLGLDSSTAIVQKTAREQVAELVGKRVLPDGSIVDNPRAKYRISDKTRDDIRQSIHTSISMGENREQAIDRLRTAIRNPKRAEVIAQTESVNAYNRGLLTFGNQSGAVGKEWQSVGAIDICAAYEALGPVPISYSYDGRRGPAAHPRCRCGLRLIYRNEVDADPDLFKGL